MGSRQFYECIRCDRDFSFRAAREQHIRDSSRHNVCHLCDLDFEERCDLNSHLEDDHRFCVECDQQFGTAWLLEEHDIDEHNLCTMCGRYFNSPSNLNNHKIIHADKDIECAGCYRKFATNSAMMLHLEAGTCPSEADLGTIDELASECRQSHQYSSDDPAYNYGCPSCRTPFRYMSGLLQHIENGSCDEDLSWYSALGIFLRFIRSRI